MAAHEQDYQRVVSGNTPTTFIEGTQIEIIRDHNLSRPPVHVLFDFDGTLSLIREGWPEVMIPMMVKALRETGTAESDEELQSIASTFVMELNGKQTIYQMIRLAAEIEKRGGQPAEPTHYKGQYHDLLMLRIEARREQLRSGEVDPTQFLVPGTQDLLNRLRDQGASLYLASGTDEEYVKEEVNLLGLGDYFGEHVHGAVDDYKSFSKAQVIQRILTTHSIEGADLLGFGDGYVEIQNIKSVGGTAVAVASDESGRSGKPDMWKRDRLIGVGADIVIPDFRESDALLSYLRFRRGNEPS
ncbi:MAG: HAD hydrolase-like protein [Planctomycetaceae bacterium]|nr:HAD hydrolase-like protein [Planctomycetaceae bacterium]